MSGINEINKKAKLAIDEMYDNQADGKLGIQNNGIMGGKQTKHMDGPIAVKQENHPTTQLSTHPIIQENFKPNFQENSQMETADLNQALKDTLQVRNTSLFLQKKRARPIK